MIKKTYIGVKHLCEKHGKKGSPMSGKPGLVLAHLLLTCLILGAEAAAPVMSVTRPASQRAGSKVVDIWYNLEFSTGGGVCSHGHGVEYQYDWGDGNQSGWGVPSAFKSFAVPGAFDVRARAGCAVDIAVMSDWSTAKSVTVSPLSQHTLSIVSSGANAVDIVSSTGHGGTTPFEKQVLQDTAVTVAAPQYVGSGAARKRFTNWTSAFNSESMEIAFDMDGAKSLIANYVDDPEGFGFLPPAVIGGHDFVLQWSSVTNRFYHVKMTHDLTIGFTGGYCVSNLDATPPINVYTTTVQQTPSFYRVEVTTNRLSSIVSPPPGMVLIPGGTNAGTDPDFGPYSLTVTSFYMDRYEVTKALWDEVKNWNGGNGYSYNNAGLGKAPNHPVQTVSWYDCVKLCNARSEKEGRTPVYYTDAAMTQIYKTGQVLEPYVKTSANGYRLPTEVQWQYAARGGVANRRFPWGDSDTIQHDRANYYSFSSSAFSYDTSPTRGYHPSYNFLEYPYTSPVGDFAPNGYGLYDMAGNVWEWCYDWHPAYVGSARAFRGGSWDRFASESRVAHRAPYNPVAAFGYLGFRAVLPPGQQ